MALHPIRYRPRRFLILLVTLILLLVIQPMVRGFVTVKESPSAIAAPTPLPDQVARRYD